jgi:hypothetical protein
LDSDGNGGGIIVVGGTANVDATDVDGREDGPYWDKYREDAAKFGLTEANRGLQHPAEDRANPGVDDTDGVVLAPRASTARIWSEYRPECTFGVSGSRGTSMPSAG